MTFGLNGSWLFRSLRARLFVLLSVLLLPLGAIGVYQTLKVVGEARQLAQRDILARTAQAASEEIAEIRRAIGAAQALGVLSRNASQGLIDCDSNMRAFIEGNPEFDFAGYISADGTTKCLSGPEPESLAGIHAELSRFPATDANVNIVGSNRTPEGVSLVTSVLVTNASGAVEGTATIRIRQARAVITLSETERNLSLALMDQHGDVLTASSYLGLDSFSTMGLQPGKLSIQPHGSILSLDKPLASGNVAAIVPVGDTGLYTVGLWKIEPSTSLLSLFNASSVLLPAIMWIASLGVAYFAIDQLVLRHLRVMRRRMAGFSLEQSNNRDSVKYVQLTDAPAELREIADSYNAMVSRITQDAAQLEQNVIEKDVLLKEVNHRVKNNLQLISSMLNMQLRTLAPGMAHSVMQRVQTRIMSLALVHRALYVNHDFKEVRVDKILASISESLIGPAAPLSGKSRFALNLAPVVVDPDQAVPLCLATAEAISNALADAQLPINVSLSESEEGVVTLAIDHIADESVEHPKDTALEIFGERLIDALVIQLEGTSKIVREGAAHTLFISFTKKASNPLPVSNVI